MGLSIRFYLLILWFITVGDMHCLSVTKFSVITFYFSFIIAYIMLLVCYLCTTYIGWWHGVMEGWNLCNVNLPYSLWLQLSRERFVNLISVQLSSKKKHVHTVNIILQSNITSCFMHIRADSRFAPSQWETSLLCSDVSHWLGAKLESAVSMILTK